MSYLMESECLRVVSYLDAYDKINVSGTAWSEELSFFTTDS